MQSHSKVKLLFKRHVLSDVFPFWVPSTLFHFTEYLHWSSTDVVTDQAPRSCNRWSTRCCKAAVVVLELSSQEQEPRHNAVADIIRAVAWAG